MKDYMDEIFIWILYHPYVNTISGINGSRIFDPFKYGIDRWIIGVDEKGISIGTGAVSVRGEVTGYCENPNKLIDAPVDVNVGSITQGKITDCMQVGETVRKPKSYF